MMHADFDLVTCLLGKPETLYATLPWLLSSRSGA
jgi:hypothetical protein